MMDSMKRLFRSRRFSAWFITATLAGLSILQLLLLGFAWELKNQAFVRNVDTALSLTAAQLESREIQDRAVELLEHAGGDTLAGAAVFRVAGCEPAAAGPARTRIQHIYADGTVRRDTLTIFDETRVWRMPVDGPETREIEFDVACTDSAETYVLVQGERTDLVERIVGDLMAYEARPIHERLSGAEVDSILETHLRGVGVDARLAYGVFETGSDSLVLASDPSLRDVLAASDVRTRLYALDLAPPHYDLVLHFPGERAYLAGQIWPFWLASLFFMSVIVASFVHTLRANAAQQSYAEHLVGFVNNMTHEFKTPISTVSLASEALARDDVRNRPEQHARFNRMIRDETRRMDEQVEKILQIARLESGDLELNLAPLEVDALVSGVVASFELRAGAHGGRIAFEPGVPATRVAADEVHLAGAVGNLLDNALKYTLDAPEITVSTRVEASWLVIDVADRGPGIAEADRRRVFEKYYRGQTGNRHDVKGFGLGLSYVEMMVEAHGGRVDLTGRPGGGTVARVRLPLAGDGPASREG